MSESPIVLSPLRCIALIIAIWVVGLGAAMQFAKVALALSELSTTYSREGPVLGVLVTLVSLLGAGLGLFAGILAERIGLRRLLLGAAVLGVVCSVAQATLPSFSIMLGIRVVEGLSHLGIVVAAPALIGTLTPERWRNSAMTLWSTFFSIGFTITAWVGLPIVAHYGLSGLFLAQGVFLAVATLATAVLLPIERPPSGSRDKLNMQLIISMHRKAYQSPDISAPAWGWLAFILSFVALLGIMPQLVPQQQSGFLAGAMPIATILSSMTLGVALLRKWPAVQVIMLAFGVAAIVSLAIALWEVNTTNSIALFAIFGLVQGASFAAIPQLNSAPADQALASGAIAQMGNLGNLLGTPMFLAVLGWGGAEYLMITVAMLCGVGVFLHLAMARLRAMQSS